MAPPQCEQRKHPNQFLGLMRMHTDPKSEAGLCRVCDFEDDDT